MADDALHQWIKSRDQLAQAIDAIHELLQEAEAGKPFAIDLEGVIEPSISPPTPGHAVRITVADPSPLSYSQRHARASSQLVIARGLYAVALVVSYLANVNAGECRVEVPYATTRPVIKADGSEHLCCVGHAVEHCT